jgi:hypothetical protein
MACVRGEPALTACTPDAGGAGCGAAAGDRRCGKTPNNSGFHQTSRNAVAKPKITARAKKLNTIRALRTEYSLPMHAGLKDDLCIMPVHYFLGNTAAAEVCVKIWQQSETWLNERSG